MKLISDLLIRNPADEWR